MRVGIIGAGKVGSAFAFGLKHEGTEVSGIYSKSGASVEFLNNRMGTAFENDMKCTIENSDLVLICVSDGQIAKVAEEISSISEEMKILKKAFIHCSGSLTSSVLEPVRMKGAAIGSLHPIQSFADKENGWKGLYGIYYGYEGSKSARALCEQIVRNFKGKILDIAANDKPIYHAAACVLSNYTVALSYICEKMLESIGIDGAAAIKAFAPLIEKTAENIISFGSVKALTGPISRGDYEVVEGHIRKIEAKMPEWLQAYKAMGRAALAAALEKGTVGNERQEEFIRLFEGDVR
jgi:predicted short-subunit dehydrogenase-like oxidoreductase (DUF2520 family)